MPRLMWTGREKVVNYHKEVPFKFLDLKYHFGGASENKIIHGDNLEVLKSLLPYYEGKIKCIYIDPPYNTGNEGWIYNDNVNDPQIQKWLNQVVGKEGEDFNRHDKWLCMMYPRLRLMQKLLSDDGAIFISIDDNEQANLKLICDEIFGANNFIVNIVWQKKYGPANDAKWISDTHDFILIYAKSKEIWRPHLLPRTEKQMKDYKNPDNDSRGLWRASDLSARTYSANCDYEIIGPTGKIFNPPPTRSWSVSKETFQKLIEENKIWWGKNQDSRPMRKKFLFEVRDGITPESWWSRDFADDNKIAKYESKEIFGENSFMTPKPTRLIERVLQIASNKDSIILDAFAGSGTTAHAVINLNQQDGGNRKFILIESMDYCETITAERVRRVGGNFNYYELGAPLFINDELNPKVDLNKIREYIYYSETRQPLEVDDEYYLGTYNDTAYYFCYNHDENIILDKDLIDKLKDSAAKKVIYASACNLSGKTLFDRNITFKKIPRDIMKL